ncbi:MAG: hypothetical protein QM638_20080 [Nocardioides sp.]|uniref:hypothetical protein n=1 Tax=Nocardioides sp. TaxID=35761 RepID=UPI0039E70561
MDNGAWGALALALTVLGGIWTWYAFRNRGVASGVRGAGLTMLPIAAYLTHTLRMFGRVGSAVADWATGFVFSPAVWVGIVIGAVGFLLIFVSTKLSGKEADPADTQADIPTTPRAAGTTGGRRQLPRTGRSDGGVSDTLGDDLDDINAILKKHGIS